MSNRSPLTITVPGSDRRRLEELARAARMQLVHSEYYTSDMTQIPVLSPLGVALIGLKVGSQMLFSAAGRSQVRYCDHKTGDVRDVVSVYPHEAQIALKRLSVLTQVEAGTFGLSVGQTIEFKTPVHQSDR